MAINWGIHLGLSFAEHCWVDSQHPQQPIKFLRTYLPQEPIGTSLKKLLPEFPGGADSRVIVSSHLLEKILPTRLGGSVAQLVTQGFEDWLWLRQPSRHALFELSPKRGESLATQEHIIGVKERINAQGEVIQALDDEEIQRVIGLLKAKGLEKICVNLLFSNINSKHQTRLVSALKENGLQVFSFAADKSLSDEAPLWRRNVLNACLAGSFFELRDEMIEALSPTFSKDRIGFINGSGQVSIDHANEITSTLFGPTNRLATFYKKDRKPILNLGLERWFYVLPEEIENEWQSTWGAVHCPHSKSQLLDLQPTSSLGRNDFGVIDFLDDQIGYEPGPMSMGRALKPSLFDVLISQTEIPELSRWINNTGTSRFQETLQTLKKTAMGTMGNSEKSLKELFSEIGFRIGLQVSLESAIEKDIICTGIFAPSLVPVLKELWPEKNWSLCPYSREIGGLSSVQVS